MSERERQVMKKLKEVVDKQRDEIRARDRELGLKNEDVEAVSGSPRPVPALRASGPLAPLLSFRGLWAAGSGSSGRGADPRPSVCCPRRERGAACPVTLLLPRPGGCRGPVRLCSGPDASVSPASSCPSGSRPARSGLL